MHPRQAKMRRLMALHNAELAGREWARLGKDRSGNPYSGKKLRGATVELSRSWDRGFDEQSQAK